MVGGLVIQIAEVVWDGSPRLFLNCQEQVWSSKEQRQVSTKQTCAIFVEPDERTPYVEFGDTVWWHGDTAFWTPRDRSDGALMALALALGITDPVDVKLRKIGGSGVELVFMLEEGGKILNLRTAEGAPV